jgi:solute carrier family 50 protein (sugar transporter)
MSSSTLVFANHLSIPTCRRCTTNKTKMASAFITTIKILTTFAQIATRLSPAPDLYHVHKQRSTGVMAFTPIIAMLLCNHVWYGKVCTSGGDSRLLTTSLFPRLIYAYVVENIFPLFSVCVFGDIVLTIYIIIYAKWCPDRAYVVKAIGMGAIPIVLVSIYAILVAVGAIDQSRRRLGLVLGYIADVTTLALFVSPFEKVKLVIQTKSAAAIPVLLCSIIFVNSGLWLLNGIVDDDLFIVVPNIVGVLLSASQLTLYFIYRPSRHVSSADTRESDLDAVELEGGTAEPKTTEFASLRSPKALAK